ncbi:MAG TPA: UDP-3-O-(3-hydroxymyristoyl)glucosamine N-acyltransferase [Planctomycetes bacterium]|nr:UDP-3-O-(3-hydroxymyristoyl)glucosamine N-acyltransferase [Planctomycetota bacterium]HIJ71240.1 UDP-3-O-(3-hydroxymyristoyl)glucosamine N-acyltransferase [Planctomycetota bacterium]
MANQTKQTVLTVAEVAKQINAHLLGNGGAEVTGVNSIEQADPSQISFVTSKRYGRKIAGTKAAAVIVTKQIDSVAACQLVVENVEAALITVLNLFAPKLTPTGGVHATAVVESSAVIGSDVSIGPAAYIGHGVKVGAGSIIGAGCVIGENSVVGTNCRLDANVVVYHNCSIGNNCIIQANATIGSVGFGYYIFDGRPKLIPHNGDVVIEDCVEIGAGSCVDRAKFGSTIIGAGTKIDNLVQIAHNVVIGKCCLIAGLAGLSGSCSVGDGVVLAGQAGVADHIQVGDGAVIGAASGVLGDIADGRKVLGIPAIDARKELQIWAVKKQLPDMAKQLKDVIKRVNKLEASENNSK